MLQIPVFLTVRQDEAQADKQCAGFGGEGCQPQAVDAQNGRYHKDGGNLQNQRPQEGNGGGDRAVVQGREHRGGEDIQSHTEECRTVEPEGMDRQFIESRVIPHKEPGKRPGQKKCPHAHSNAGNHHERNAFAEHILHLAFVVRPIVIADNGRGADGIANEHGDKEEAHIHNHPVGGHAVLPQEFEQLEIIDHGGDGAGDIGHQL